MSFFPKNRPHNVALVVPDWIAISSELGLSEFDAIEDDMVNDERVKGLISSEIKLNCYKVKKFEVPLWVLWIIVRFFYHYIEELQI